MPVPGRCWVFQLAMAIAIGMLVYGLHATITQSRTWLWSAELYNLSELKQNNSHQHQEASEKELFLCSSTTLGKTGLLFLE